MNATNDDVVNADAAAADDDLIIVMISISMMVLMVQAQLDNGADMLRLKLTLAQLYLYQEHIYKACDILRSLGDLSYSLGVVRSSAVFFVVFMARQLLSLLKTFVTLNTKYCRSGTAGRCCMCTRQTLRVHSAGDSMCEVTSWPPSSKCYVKSRIRLCQLMHIYSQNKFV